MKKILLIIGTLVVLVLLAVLVLSRPAAQEYVSDTQTDETTEEAENPVEEEIPDLNPAANTNPFSDVYKNPFE